MRPALALLALLLALPVRADEADDDAQVGLIPVGGIVLFYNSQGPLLFDAMTRRDLPKDAVPIGEVKGTSCQHSLAVPLSASLGATSVSGALGDGSYRKALRDIHQKHPELKGVYDVKVDLHLTSILRVYNRLCTEVTAFGFK